MLTAIVLLMIVGFFCGILSGMLGFGGSFILVPTLLYLLPSFGIASDERMHAALATSLATGLFVSVVSIFNHWRYKHIPFTLIRQLTPGTAMGAAVAIVLAKSISDGALTWIFLLIVGWAFMQIVYDMHLRTRLTASNTNNDSVTQPAHETPTTSSQTKPLKQLPAALYMFFVGSVGAVSGGGAAMLTTPYLNRYGYPIRIIAAQSSIQACVIAAVTTAVFIITRGKFDQSTSIQWMPLAILASTGIVGSIVGAFYTTIARNKNLQWLFLGIAALSFASVLVSML